MPTRRCQEARTARREAWWLRVRVVAPRLLIAAAVAMTLGPLAAVVRGRSFARDTREGQTAAPAQVEVTLEAVATLRTGATDRPRATVARIVPVGDHVRAGFDAGGAEGTDLCEVGSMPGGEGSVGRVRWRVDAIVEAADASTVTLTLAWQRSAGETPIGRRTVPLSDQRTVRLRAGESHVLDLVQADTESPSACANVLLRVRAARVDSAVRTPRWLRYDLWLTYERAGGDQTSRHLQLAGPEDTPVRTAFLPLRWRLDRVWAGTPSQASVHLAVTGTVRGRCRPDGAVDVALDTVRTVAVGSASGAGEGHIEFVVTPGDTVAVEIPNLTATLTAPWATVAGTAQPWAPGVQGLADTVTVDLGEFFRGSRVRVVVSGGCE